MSSVSATPSAQEVSDAVGRAVGAGLGNAFGVLLNTVFIRIIHRRYGAKGIAVYAIALFASAAGSKLFEVRLRDSARAFEV